MACFRVKFIVHLVDSESTELRKAVKADGSLVQGTVPYISWKEKRKYIPVAVHDMLPHNRIINNDVISPNVLT
jgi:hypothetical protein